MLRNCSMAVVTFIIPVLTTVNVRGDQPGERLLLGFEPNEIEQMAETLKKDKIKLKRTSGKSSDGKQQMTVGIRPWTGFREWKLLRGAASQGKWAMTLRPTRLSVWTNYRSRPRPAELREVDRFYGLYQRADNFNIAGVLRKVVAKDWSKFERLRFDVFVKTTAQTVHVAIEDEDIMPPVIRSLLLQPGKWTTMEVDLREVVKQRGLDLKRLATLRIGFTVPDPAKAAREARRSGKKITALLDNIRLCKKGEPAKLPLVSDKRPHLLPEYFKTTASKPAPQKLPPGKPDHSPLTLQKPFRIDMPKPCFVSPAGWVAAYDNSRVLVGFSYGGIKDAYVLQTLDGGRKWSGWNGTAKPGLVPLREMTHQAGRGDVVGRRGDVMLLTTLGCKGPGNAGPTLFTETLSLRPLGWTLRKEPALLDCDLRHCTSNQSIVRVANGRLYAAYGYTSRLGTIAIGVRCSDDDGRTWRSWRPGMNGIVPGTTHSQKDGIGFGYTFEEPCLVPFGEHIACIWCKRAGYEYREIVWTRFDGKKWSPIEVIIKTRKRDAYNPTRPATHAVSVGADEIFMVNALYKGVLHYKNGRWTSKAKEIPPGSRISVAGDKHIVVIAAHGEKSDQSTSPGVAEGKGAVELRVWHRLASGKWKGPITVAREPMPFASPDNRYCARPGFVVQPYAPPNFVPVAWSCGKKWVKVLRVPITQ